MFSTILKRLISRTVAQFGFAYQNLPTFRYWTKIAIGREVSRVVKTSVFQGNVALVAAFQNKPSISFDIMLKDLRSRGMSILLVSNAQLTPDFESWLLNRVDGLIVRDNVGRDIAAYRDGVLHLVNTHCLPNIDQLLFINDTILFPVIDSDYFWRRFLAIDSDVVGAFESFSPRHHVQSFFFMVRKNVLQKKYFLDFWKKYRSWNSRKHAVQSGEIGFSQYLKSHGASISAVVNAETCVEALNAPVANHKSLFSTIQTITYGHQQRMLIGKRVINPEYRALSFGLEKINPSHALCEFALTELQVPILKKDLVYRGTLSLVDIVRISEKVDLQIPLSELQATYRVKGLPAEISRWKKSLLRIGVQ